MTRWRDHFKGYGWLFWVRWCHWSLGWWCGRKRPNTVSYIHYIGVVLLLRGVVWWPFGLVVRTPFNWSRRDQYHGCILTPLKPHTKMGHTFLVKVIKVVPTSLNDLKWPCIDGVIYMGMVPVGMYNPNTLITQIDSYKNLGLIYGSYCIISVSYTHLTLPTKRIV